MIISKNIVGRLGNQLFQVASVVGLARRFGHEYALPKLDIFSHFYTKFVTGDVAFFDRNVREGGFAYDDEFWKFQLSNPKEVINIQGYLQSPKYWGEDGDFVKKLFQFNNSFKNILPEGTNIALHVRRGDYVGNSSYYNLSSLYYINALELLPKGNVVVFTDDYNYCKNIFSGRGFDFSLEGMSDVEHLYLMTQCDHFVLSNSSFSWWGAYLGEKPYSKVIRPDKYFAGNLKGHDTKDFWPEHWSTLEATADTDDLSDVTFVVPISYDSKERKRNIQVLLRHLIKNYKCKIILGEQGSDRKFKYLERYVDRYVYFDMQHFHRTKMINEMVKITNTPIVAICDADVLVPSGQMLSAANKIRAKQSHIVYPYDGRFVRCLSGWTGIFDSDPYRVNAFSEVYHNMNLFAKPSLGGIFLVDKSKYIEAGMENENFISFGREDVERYYRFKELGLTVSRECGCLYHLHHPRGINSTMRHPNAKRNSEEAKKVIQMKYTELREYVNSWDWLKS